MSLTRQQVLAMTTFVEVSKAIKDPETSGPMQRLLTDREVAVHVSKLMQARAQEQVEREAVVDAETARVVPPSTEELAAQAAAVAATPEPAAPTTPTAPDTSAEDAEYKVEGVVVSRDTTGRITRLVQEYQVRDEDGRPIGRPTHLEAKSALELLSKQRVAHEEAVRFGYRMKKHKLTQKVEPRTVLTAEQLKEAVTQFIQEKDPSKAEDVVLAVIESQFGKREAELRAEAAQLEGRAIANEFRANHLHDYNACTANQNAIKEYLISNKLDFTLDNLEICFAVLMEEGKLVKVERLSQTSVDAAANTAQTTAGTTAAGGGNPAPAQPAPATTPAVTQPQVPSTPVVEATVTTPAAAHNVQPAARRPGVNGSLPPGSLSAQRPVPVDPTQARKEFMQSLHKMSAEEIRRKKNNDPQFVAQLATYGIKLQ